MAKKKKKGFKKLSKIFKKVALPVAGFGLGVLAGPAVKAIGSKLLPKIKSKFSKAPKVGEKSSLRPESQTADNIEPDTIVQQSDPIYRPQPILSPSIPLTAGAGACGASGGDWQVIMPTILFTMLVYYTIRYFIRKRFND